MSWIDLDTAHATEFLEYPKILPTHRLAVDFDLKELFVGQRFESKEEVLEVSRRLQLANVRCIYPEVVDVGYLGAKNGATPSQPDGGGTRICRIYQKYNGYKPVDGKVDGCKSIFTT
ncbi:hypothetical protein GOBAR_DD32323 [Gossypium barbadense]|nr:hypothetical protein GOBAR_DD32323 [Gossypium barbadense]